MKLIIKLIILACLVFGCSTQHYLNKADFNNAIKSSVKALRKDHSNTEEIEHLNYAYNKASQIDHDRIAFLFESNEPTMWNEIHNRYTALYQRQESVKTLPNDILMQINFQEENYAAKITESKKNAAEYYYQNGLNLLSTKDKFDARKAYTSFTRAQSFYNNYKDVSRLLVISKANGTNNVLFLIKNNSGIALPETFEEEVLKISLTNLNKTWINYDTRVVENRHYDYYIQLSLQQIAASPEDTHSSSFVETREIEDGFNYLLDAKGNVQRDTSGNDIKIPIIKVIECKVVETFQKKQVVIEGTIDYIKTIDNQLLKSETLGATTIFDHHSAQAFGNINALTLESRKLIGTDPLPYPATPIMILDAASIVKENAKVIINRNSRLISN